MLRNLGWVSLFAALGAVLIPRFAIPLPEQGLPLRELAPGVYAYVGAIAPMNAQNIGAIANLGVVVGETAVAVIDTGGSMVEGQRLRAAIRELTDKPIRYVITTHVHPDHWFGNAAFVPEGPRFVGHARLADALAARAAFYIERFEGILGPGMMAGVRAIAPTLAVSATTELDLGGRILTVQAWPAAHTDDDLTVFDQQTQTLFTGDLLFVAHIPVLDGNLLSWLQVLDRLAAVPARHVVPGHGPIVADLAAAIAPQRAYLQTLVTDVRAALARGLPLRAAVETVGASQRVQWQLFDDYNARNATAAFAELEWE